MGFWPYREAEIIDDWAVTGEIEGGAIEGGLFDSEPGDMPAASCGSENSGNCS